MQNLSILKHNFSQEKIQKILDKKEQIIQQEKLSEELKEKMQQRKTNTPYAFTISSASAFIAERLSSFSADLIVTEFSARQMSFISENVSAIFFAAIGAQEPFSIKKTLRF